MKLPKNRNEIEHFLEIVDKLPSLWRSKQVKDLRHSNEATNWRKSLSRFLSQIDGTVKVTRHELNEL